MTRSRPLAALLAVTVTVAATAPDVRALTPPAPEYVVTALAAAGDGSLLVAESDGHLYRRGPDQPRWQSVREFKPHSGITLFAAGTSTYLAQVQAPYAPPGAPAESAWQSTDGGQHWRPVPPHRWMAAEDFRTVLACDDGRQVLHSGDGGATWGAAGAPPHGCAQGLAVFAERLYALDHGHLARSENAGSPWVEVAAPAGAYRVEVDTAGRVVVAARDAHSQRETVWRSADLGRSWKPMDFGQKGWNGSTRLVAVQYRLTLAVLDKFASSIARVCIMDDDADATCADLDRAGMARGGDLPWHGDAVYDFDAQDVREMRVGSSGWLPSQPTREAGLPDAMTGKPREH